MLCLLPKKKKNPGKKLFYRHVLDEWWKFSETFKDQIIPVKIQRIKKQQQYFKDTEGSTPSIFL